MRAELVEGVDQRCDVVAVDPQRLPAERLPLVGDRLGAQDALGGAVGLQGVDVDDRGHVVQAVVGGLQRGLPRRALVELTVGEQVVHPGRVALVAQPQRHPGRDRQAVPERAAGDLHARGVGRHARHRQPGLVRAVGLQLLDRDDPGLGQRRVQRDGVVADREQEPVPARPVRVRGSVAQLVACRPRRARRRRRAPARCSPGPAPRPSSARSAGPGTPPPGVARYVRPDPRPDGRRRRCRWPARPRPVMCSARS